MIPDRLAVVFARIDAANAEDPTPVAVDGASRPHALVYGEWMSACLDRLAPEASELLRIAVRAQHLRRFDIPRADYPMDKPGYFAWRNAQKARHAELVGGYMREAGYDAAAIERVGGIVRKERLKRDDEVQTLEDCACLVFLEHEFAPFADGHPDDKVVDIVAKTWPKMSDRGRAAAVELLPAMSERLRTLTLLAVAAAR